MNHSVIESVSDGDLLAATRGLAANARLLEAELLAHLGEVDARKLYAGLGHSSMFAWCTRELGFSEDAAGSRILVARTARKLPQILEAARSGRVHLTGLRLVAPHLTPQNCDAVLASATGKTADAIRELVARLAPQPAVETTIRKIPARRDFALTAAQRPAAAVARSAPRPVVPLAEDLYKIQLTAPRAFKEKLKRAQDLSGDDAFGVLSAALDLLLEHQMKKRIGAGQTGPDAVDSGSRYIPASIRRAVWERDGGRCAFIGTGGTRCAETRSLQFDHVDGFARTHRHDAERMRLLCRAHNQHAANLLYGVDFMEQKRRDRA